MQVQSRSRIDNIEVSRQHSGNRYHFNPCSEAMGPVVKQGFVADRVQNLQRVASKLEQTPPSRTPSTPRSVPETVQTNECGPLPDSYPVRVDGSWSYGPETPRTHTKQLLSQSCNEKRWIKSSPSTPVLRTPTGAALYWDRKIQSLRHPPTPEALEIRRLRREQRSYENVKERTSSVVETSSRHQKHPPRPTDRYAHNEQREQQEASPSQNFETMQESGDGKPQSQFHKANIGDQMGDMIHHIDQALRERYGSSADLGSEAQDPDAGRATEVIHGERNASPRRRLFRESQVLQTPSLSGVTGASQVEASRSNTALTDSHSKSSEDEPRLNMLLGSRDAQSLVGKKIAVETSLPRSRSGVGWDPTDPFSPPHGGSRALSSRHADVLDDVHQSLVKVQPQLTNHTPAQAAPADILTSAEELESVDRQINECQRPIPPKPEFVDRDLKLHRRAIHGEPVPAWPDGVNHRHQPILNVGDSSSRRPSDANRKASMSSIRSSSSQGSKKWRWWKLALVDKQLKDPEPRERQSTPDLIGLDIRASNQGEKVKDKTTPHPPVETILEAEAEREHASINEVLDASPERGLPARRSPSLAETRTRRSTQWVAALPSPGSVDSGAQTPARPDGLRASVGPEAKKKDQRIRKVQVIVSLDGASDLVVEASLERKRRKSFS